MPNPPSIRTVPKPDLGHTGGGLIWTPGPKFDPALERKLDGLPSHYCQVVYVTREGADPLVEVVFVRGVREDEAAVLAATLWERWFRQEAGVTGPYPAKRAARSTTIDQDEWVTYMRDAKRIADATGRKLLLAGLPGSPPLGFCLPGEQFDQMELKFQLSGAFNDALEDRQAPEPVQVAF